MQLGTIQRHGRGWRGSWREDGRRRTTPTCRTQSEAKRLLKAQLDRLEQGDTYVAPITLQQLCDRFLERHQAQPVTIQKVRYQLETLTTAIGGSVQASDVTGEEVETWLNTREFSPSYRWALVSSLRQVYTWGIRARLVAANPGRQIKASKPKRGRNQSPFESWEEVEAVAAEAGRWGAFIILMVDTAHGPASYERSNTGTSTSKRGTCTLPGQDAGQAVASCI